MLLRSSSSPLLNSWKPKSCGSSPESDLLPITTQQLIRTRSVLMSTSFGPDESPTKHAPNRSRDPAVQKKNINGSKREVKTVVPAKLKDKELGSTGVRILLSNSGLGKSEEDKERGLKTLVAGGVGGGGGGGGRVCGGGGSGGTRDGDGSGSQDSNSWHGYKSTDVYYQKMIEAYPRNGLLLANYARYLKEVYNIAILIGSRLTIMPKAMTDNEAQLFLLTASCSIMTLVHATPAPRGIAICRMLTLPNKFEIMGSNFDLSRFPVGIKPYHHMPKTMVNSKTSTLFPI